MMEMDKVLYHTNAWAEGGASIYILSKERAPQVRGEKTHHSPFFGEKPKLAEYLVMLQISVRLMTVKSHGHTLGVVGHVMRSYCALCKAGLGMCQHRAAAL